MEEAVTYASSGGTVVGTLVIPVGKPAPVILLLHGFGGMRHEWPVAQTDEGVFARTARVFANAGFATLRIDFRGSGESSGSYADTTFESQIADGLAAIEFLASEGRVKGNSPGIIGWSQGGLVAAAVAGRANSVGALALWAAIATPRLTYPVMLGADAMNAAASGAPVEIQTGWGIKIQLSRAFFEGIATLDPIAEIMPYRGPLLVVQGRADTTVDPTSADLFLAGHKGEQMTWIEDTDHFFGILAGPETFDRMLATNLAFFSRYLLT